VRVAAVHVDALPLRIEAELFRISQEALTNVRKHAHAREVEIGLRRRGSSLSLSIRDDGRGFLNRARHPDRHGLVGMRERARLLGGRLTVTSRPGQGTRIVAAVPLGSEDQIP
jgi:signal transduction histidine kinase